MMSELSEPSSFIHSVLASIISMQRPFINSTGLGDRAWGYRPIVRGLLINTYLIIFKLV